MERFATMVIGHRTAAAPIPAPASAAKGKKGKVVEEDAAYLSIQLEEIVIVKNDDLDTSLGAVRGRITLTSGGASTSMGQRVAAAAAPPSGMSAIAAAAAMAPA